MKPVFRFFLVPLLLFFCFFLSSFKGNNYGSYSSVFPYKKAGLTERQAAAHLLNRFTFGAKHGQVDEVIAMGLEKWFMHQLEADLPDEEMNGRLRDFDALRMSDSEIVNTFVRPAQVLRMAIKDGVINKDSVDKADKAAYRSIVFNYMQQHGWKPQNELFRQLQNQKIVRAAYSNNQLQEVLTDFWFNHFNVSITKNDCAEYILSYERDVIRPNSLGKFGDLLLATAKSPSMLMYLDNFSSSGADSSISMAGKQQRKRLQEAQMEKMLGGPSIDAINKLKNRKKGQGINENYAREVMELHTLGVDGGYTQNDVTQAARVLTGWTVYPMSDYGPGNAIRKIIDRIGEDKFSERGFVHEGDFLFTANRHDNGEKVVLGNRFKAGRGYDEGVELLKMLAHHASTAKFISRKIAVRFVSDNPPQTLIDKMAKTFTTKEGDIKQVLLTMVSSPEFWSTTAIREKTKSPFELAISAVRSIDADVKMPYPLYTWIDKMGQKLYYYQAPTGFPDKGQYWINTGALLNRMNFGLALASGKIPGVRIDLLKLNQGHEPESAEAALLVYGKMIMPERDLQQSISRLTPLLHDPKLPEKIENKANKQSLSQQSSEPADDSDQMNSGRNPDKKQQMSSRFTSASADKGNATMLAQVVGIIIGSPEFQRR